MFSVRNKINYPFKLGKLYFSPNYTFPYAAFASKAKPQAEIKSQSPMKLVFDQDNKTTIFKHADGENGLKWMVRGNLIFTALNAFLFFTETIQPIFGGWNYFSFCLGLGMGVGGTMALHIFSRRTISEIKLFRTGDYVEVFFFNAYWIPKSKVYHVSEFANMTNSHFGYTRSEITSLGKVWINLDKNVFGGIPMYDELTRDVLNGSIVKLSKIDAMANKAHQYRK